MMSASPLQPAHGQQRRSFSRLTKFSPPSSHLMASSSPICWMSNGRMGGELPVLLPNVHHLADRPSPDEARPPILQFTDKKTHKKSPLSNRASFATVFACEIPHASAFGFPARRLCQRQRLNSNERARRPRQAGRYWSIITMTMITIPIRNTSNHLGSRNFLFTYLVLQKVALAFLFQDV